MVTYPTKRKTHETEQRKRKMLTFEEFLAINDQKRKAMTKLNITKKLNNYTPGDSRSFYSPYETDFAEDIGSPIKDNSKRAQKSDRHWERWLAAKKENLTDRISFLIAAKRKNLRNV